MCQYLYQFHSQCEHQSIKLANICKEVFFAAGLTPGLMVPCPEKLYPKQLRAVLNGKTQNGEAKWQIWEGYCRYCNAVKKLNQDPLDGYATSKYIVMSEFLPTHQEYKDWQNLVQEQSEPYNDPQQFLATIDHPLVVCSPGMRNLWLLLGVADQVEPQALAEAPIVHFEGLLKKYDPEIEPLAQWIISGKVSLNGLFLVDLLQIKDWYLIRNQGITVGDRIFIRDALNKGIHIDMIYISKFQPRGMTRDHFIEAIRPKPIRDGPNAAQDRKIAEDWNKLCEADPDHPEYRELMIPLVKVESPEPPK